MMAEEPEEEEDDEEELEEGEEGKFQKSHLRLLCRFWYKQSSFSRSLHALW